MPSAVPSSIPIAVPSAPPNAKPGRQRLESVDLLRGVIMIVMALDHTRDFFGMPGTNPTDLHTASAALFLTRWVTHFCAPVFFLLTGTGAALSLRKKTRAELSRFLVTRGLWLIFLEVVVVRCLVYQFNFDYHITMLIVLWAIGWAMIVLAALIWLPVPMIAAFGVVMIATHNLLDGINSSSSLLAVLHGPGFALNTKAYAAFAPYSLIPWVGVTAVGFALGSLYSWDADRRRAMLTRLGVATIAVFIVVRGINGYGDAAHWSHQRSPFITLLSFVNTVKYPPSLDFLLMTLGPALLFLRAVDGGFPRVLRPTLVYGKVPLFYYILHFFTIHLFAVIVCYLRYGTAHWMVESPDIGNYPFIPPPRWGYPLPVVYLIWATVVLVMYLPCRWFAGLKARRSDPWLSYL